MLASLEAASGKVPICISRCRRGSIVSQKGGYPHQVQKLFLAEGASKWFAGQMRILWVQGSTISQSPPFGEQKLIKRVVLGQCL